jgi:hypothetical protein
MYSYLGVLIARLFGICLSQPVALVAGLLARKASRHSEVDGGEVPSGQPEAREHPQCEQHGRSHESRQQYCPLHTFIPLQPNGRQLRCPSAPDVALAAYRAGG